MRRHLKPTDIEHLYSLGTPALSPDGKVILIARRSPRLAQNDYVSNLWLIRTDGSEPPRPFTFGERDQSPAFSPDGQWVAFLRPGAKGRPQLHIMRASGGDARQLTNHPLGAGAPVWSPDSMRIAYTAMVPEPGRYGTDESVRSDQEPPRLIRSSLYQIDGLGYILDRPAKIFVVDLPPESEPATAPRQITDGPWADASPSWSPNGKALTFVSARFPNADREAGIDVQICAADGSDLRTLTDGSVSASLPAYTPDSQEIMFVGVELRPERTDWAEHNLGIWRIPVGGRQQAPRRVTPKGSVDLVPPITENPQGICFAGARLIVSSGYRGSEVLLSCSHDGDDIQTLIGDVCEIRGYCVQDMRSERSVDDEPMIALAVATEQSPGEIILIAGAKRRILTDFAKPLRERFHILPPLEVVATAPDGYPVHGWVVKPEGSGPHPVLLHIHGGPHWRHTAALFDEAQVYAEAGYAVAMCNPRGSMGYGVAHSEAIDDKFGTVDADDALAFVESVASAPDLDTTRVGVMGGSYGGFLTSWLVSHTDRFTAAISERAANNPITMLGTSDLGWMSDPRPRGLSLDLLAAQSPMTFADRIRTPTLIIHQENDRRCPLEQAQQLYAALRVRGVETALLLFPGEDHNLTRSGQPRHRVQRFEAILHWWAKHLPTERNLPAASNPFT
jgi:dipeptidyl aminopeptidase/acylaminoacyl peptidase